MDKKITIRFYEVSKLRPAGPSLASVLEAIGDIDSLAAREATIAPDVTARLELLEKDEDQYTGEFTRVQKTNYPSEVHPDKRSKLGVNNPLGHAIAFRFRPSDHRLAVQYDPRVLSPSRIFSYLMTMRKDAAFCIEPCMNLTSWKRMQARPLKKLVVKIASPSSLVEIEDAGAAAADAFRRLGTAYSAPSIKIEIGMGGRKGALADTAKKMAEQVFGLFKAQDVDLRTLSATSETEPGIPNDEINLIDEILTSKDELALPDNDPEKSYELRRNWLKTKMQSHV